MTNISQTPVPLRRIIDLYPRPSLKSFAAEVGQRYQTVQQWEVNGVPPEHCYAVECAAKKVGDPTTRRELRPDDWMTIWPELMDDAEREALAGELNQ